MQVIVGRVPSNDLASHALQNPENEAHIRYNKGHG